MNDADTVSTAKVIHHKWEMREQLKMMRQDIRNISSKFTFSSVSMLGRTV